MADEIEQGVVEGGAGFREAYLFHKVSSTLVLTDMIDNVEPEKLPPVTAAALRLARATEGKTPMHVRLALRLGGEGAGAAVQRMLVLEPECVVFAHGRWFEERGAERLRRAFEWLAPPVRISK